MQPVEPCQSGEFIPLPSISSFHSLIGHDFASVPNISSGLDDGGNTEGSVFKCSRFACDDGNAGMEEFSIPGLEKLFIIPEGLLC